MILGVITKKIPDHYVTAKAVEAACWQAGSKDIRNSWRK